MGIVKKIQVLFEQRGAVELEKSLKRLSKKNKTLAETSARLGKSTGTVNSSMGQLGIKINRSGKFVDKFTNQLLNQKTALKAIKKASNRFRMEYLSFLFGAMAATRVLGNVLRSSTQAFTKIMESNNMLGTAVQRLGIHWEFLKFTIGSALNKVIEMNPWLFTLIDWATEFIQKNPDAVIWSIVSAFGALKAIEIGAQLAMITTAIKGWGGGDGLAAVKNLKGMHKWLKRISILTIAGIITFGLFKGAEESEGLKLAGEQLGVILATTFAGIWLGKTFGPHGMVIGGMIGLSIGVILTFFMGKDSKERRLAQVTKMSDMLSNVLPFGEEASILASKLEFSPETEASFKSAIFGVLEQFSILKKGVASQSEEMNQSMQSSWEHSLGLVKASSPLGWMLKQLGPVWQAMADTAILEVQRIIVELNNIPTEIITIHKIITVYETAD